MDIEKRRPPDILKLRQERHSLVGSILPLSPEGGWGRIILMDTVAIKEIAERRPFRPFAVQLNNGAKYTFNEPRDFGAPQDYREILFFGKSEWVLIDSDSIAEIIRQ
jgi:hypothetical protein